MSTILYRQLSATGDYQLGNMHVFLRDSAAVAQAIQTNLKLLYGEWWEDTTNGLPLFQLMIGANGSQASLRAVDVVVQQRILATTGVASISSFTSSFDKKTRTYSYSGTAVTIYGDTVTFGGTF